MLTDQLEDYPQIPQSEFKKYLPALVEREETASVPRAEREALRRQWLDICVDPRVSVNVVDDQTGEVIHRVPPMIYTTTEITGRNVAGMLKEWSMRNEISPIHGKQFANQHIDKTLILGDPPEEDINCWVEILKRYGYADRESAAAHGGEAGGLHDDPDAW